MARYLLRREGGIYYFRRSIPGKLRPYLGGSVQWMRSLGTTDTALAKSLRDDEAVRTNRLIEGATQKLRAGIPPEPAPPPALSAEQLERHRIARDEYDQFAQEQGELEAVRAMHDEEELEADPVKAQIADAVEAAGQRIREEQRVALQVRAEERASGRVPIMDLFDAYVAERTPAPSTVHGWRSHVRSLIAHLGHDDARRVTRANIIAWKDVLLSEKVKGKHRSGNTINGSYLAAAAAVFGWGLRNERVSINPAADVKASAPKKVRLREPDFSETEALTILQAALVPPSGKLTPEHVLARRWVPWLCAYTGARVNEITQLRREDVQRLGAVWTIRITPEAGTTKNQEARIVPLHDHLIEQGFPEAIAALGQGPVFYDPSRQSVDKQDKRPFRKVGDRLAEWVKGLGIAGVQPNHGWRHRFKTVARRVKMDREARDVIQGHAARTEGERYGSWEPETLAAEIAKLPRFVMPAEAGSG